MRDQFYLPLLGQSQNGSALVAYSYTKYRNTFEYSVLVVRREGHTRSHSEHGSQALSNRWYLAFQLGRVGRRQHHGRVFIIPIIQNMLL